MVSNIVDVFNENEPNRCALNNAGLVPTSSQDNLYLRLLMRTSISKLAKINNLDANNQQISEDGEINFSREKAHKSDSAL